MTTISLKNLDSNTQLIFSGNGWFFWTGKTEEHCAPEWDYMFMLENDLLPQDICNRPTYC